MNAHDRRKESRRRHMAMPIGKEVRLSDLAGRWVYTYGRISAKIKMTPDQLGLAIRATVNRHYRGLIDLLLVNKAGDEQIVQTSMRGLRLVNPADKAARPWWVETRRKHAARAKQGGAA